jgi:putative oxidoreductase
MREDLGLLLLRLTSGGLMLTHGVPKLLNYSMASSFADPLHISSPLSWFLTIFAEVFCAALVVAGIFTRYAAVPLVITMVVAAGVVHSADSFSRKELAVLYGAMYVVVILCGPGRFSLAGLFNRARP